MKLGKIMIKTAGILLGAAVLAGGVLGFSREVKAGVGSWTSLNSSGTGSNLEWMYDTSSRVLTVRPKNPPIDTSEDANAFVSQGQDNPIFAGKTPKLIAEYGIYPNRDFTAAENGSK